MGSTGLDTSESTEMKHPDPMRYENIAVAIVAGCVIAGLLIAWLLR